MKHISKVTPAIVVALFLLSFSFISMKAKTSQGLAFNGYSFIALDDVYLIPASGDFTVECWAFCPAAPNSFREIISQGSAGNAFYLGIALNNNIRVGDTWPDTGVPFPYGGWHHLAVSRSSTNTILYVDGINRASLGHALTNPSGGSKFSIGRQYGSYGEYWIGRLDEVRVWNVARNAEEIRTSRIAQLEGTEPGLLACWQFDDTKHLFDPISSVATSGSPTGYLPNCVSGAWTPALQFNGENPVTVEWNTAYTDPGARRIIPAISIATGHGHVSAVRADGTVTGWGINNDGQLDIPASATNMTAMVKGYYHTLALRADGTVTAWGLNDEGQCNVPGTATRVTAIAAGGWHNLALRMDGSVVAWGYNSHGQINVPATVNNVIAIAAGARHSIAVRSDGSVICWGLDSYSICKPPKSATNVVAVAAGAYHNIALRKDGSVMGWGENSFNQATIPDSAYDVTAVAANANVSMALKRDGTVVVWGKGDNGHLDVPYSARNVTAISIGDYTCMALKSDGSIINWGLIRWEDDAISNLFVVPPTLLSRDVLNTTQLGPQTLAYSFTNNLGLVQTISRTVQVADTTQPMLSLNGTNSLVLPLGSVYVEPGATALDSCAGDLTDRIQIDNPLNTQVLGNYTITYSAIDPSGNTGTVQRAVIVADKPRIETLSGIYGGTNSASGSPILHAMADVNPNGQPTTITFQYGLKDNRAGSCPPTELPAAFTSSPTQVAIEGLLPGMSYRWSVTASNNMGAVTSPVQTFAVQSVFAHGDLNGDGIVDSAEASSVLSNYWPHSPWLTMTNLAGLGETNITFALTNDITGKFEVEYSIDLNTWQHLGPATPRYEFTDTNAPAHSQRFYRLRAP
jgi:hypothetical protein